MSGITIDPSQTRTGGTLFRSDLRGYVQGKPNDSWSGLPAALNSGYIDDAESLPMYQGAPVSLITKPTLDSRFGLVLKRATDVDEIDGFTVETLNNHAISTPTGTVPLGISGKTFNYVRLGSRAKVPLPLDPALVSSLYGKRINLSDIALSIDFDVTSATYGHVIAKGAGIDLNTLGIKVIDFAYANSKTIVRADSGLDWDKNTAFVWDNEGSVILLEV